MQNHLYHGNSGVTYNVPYLQIVVVSQAVGFFSVGQFAVKKKPNLT